MEVRSNGQSIPVRRAGSRSPPITPKPRMTTQDKYMPVFDVRERHEILVPDSAARAYGALRRVDFSRSRLIRTIFGIRTLPAYFRHQPWGTPEGPFVDQAIAMGWVVLEESPGHEFVAGAATQPWAATVKFTSIAPGHFLSFSAPGFVKIVWGFSAEPSQSGATILATETRAVATDLIARARFLRYWLFVSPGIRLIRRVALKLARQDITAVCDAA